MPQEYLPTAILPTLPRSKTDLDPLDPSQLLGNIALLRELYIPPIHGGFQVSTIGNDDTAQVKRRSRVRERRFSASLTDTMDSSGLGLDLDLDTVDSAGPSRPMPIRSTILEEREPQDSDESSQSGDSEAEDGNEDEEEGQGTGHLDPFEREWAEKWLNGVVRRAQGWIEEHEDPEDEEDIRTLKNMEAILRDSTAVLAMMAGTSAAGSLTRHLLFLLHDSLAHGVKALQQSIPLNAALSPTTTSFLASLATSPVSPTLPFRPGPTSPERPSSSNPAFSPETQRRRRRSTLRSNSDISSSPESRRNTASRGSERRRKKAAVPVLLHDAPMQDHISVGVQTWGSAILLGREMALNPSAFGLFPGPSTPTHRGVRVLELGAGTGLLAILCRKLLDLRMASMDVPQPKYPGLVVATDFHHDVLSNLKVCVDLNFPPHVPAGPNFEGTAVVATNGHVENGVQIAKLDWTTFPQYMVARQEGRTEFEEDNLEVGKWVGDSFDLVLASDCVYDPTHAKLIRDVAGWVLRLPDENDPNDQGGTLHLLSPIRPTFTPELESIDIHFPTISSYTPLADRQRAATMSDVPKDLQGEGLGKLKGLKLGVRGEGKKSVKGRKGEGRVDEVAGYWWWEVGWG